MEPEEVILLYSYGTFSFSPDVKVKDRVLLYVTNNFRKSSLSSIATMLLPQREKFKCRQPDVSGMSGLIFLTFLYSRWLLNLGLTDPQGGRGGNVPRAKWIHVVSYKSISYLQCFSRNFSQ